MSWANRFSSVDPFIQDPTFSQGLNPYSYIMNNPLAGVDPSGYSGKMTSSLKTGPF
jgi:RHS repeat-associated protein